MLDPELDTEVTKMNPVHINNSAFMNLTVHGGKEM